MKTEQMYSFFTSRWLHCTLVVASYALLFVTFFSPVLLREQLLAVGDAQREFLPAFASPFGLWTNLLFSGFPLAAEPQNQIWYWIRYLPPRSAAGWNWFVIMAYVLSASFTYGYVYRSTRNRFAAAVSGIAYGMSGSLIALLPHTNIVHTAAWLPLTIWSLHEQRHRPSFSSSWFVIESVSVASAITAGHPQIFAYDLGIELLFIAYVVCCTSEIARVRYLAVSLVGIVSGLALACIQIVPSIELWRLSVRASLPFHEFVGGSFPLRQSATLLFSFIFGGSPHSFYGLPYVGYWNFGNLVGYVGLLPLMLSCIALVSHSTSRPVHSDLLFWLSAACLVFVLALGGGTPLGTFLFHVPGYNLFRVPARHLVEFAFAVSVMAGYGAAAVAERAVSRPLVLRIITLAAVLLAATAAIEMLVSTPSSPLVTAIVVPFAVFALSGLCLILSCYKPESRFCRLWLLLTLTVDLGSFGWFCNWRYEAAPVSLLRPPNYAAKYGCVLRHSQQRMVAVQGAFAPQTSLPPNLGVLWNVPSASGYGSLIPSSISRFLAMSRSHGISSGDVGGHWWSPANQTLDLLTVRFLTVPQFVWQALGSKLDKGASLRWRFVGSIQQTAIVENLHAAPRAWLVTQVKEAKPEAILRAIQTSRMSDGSIFDGSQMAVVDEKPPAVQSGLLGTSSDVQIEQLTDTKIVIRVRTTYPGFLILSDSYYPGWRATVDAKPSHIYRTDYVLRGLAIPRGTHTVTFAFWPVSVAIGASTTGVALLGLVITCVSARLRKITTPHGPARLSASNATPMASPDYEESNGN